jgi:hypothetical protein
MTPPSVLQLAIKKRAIQSTREFQMMQSEENVPVFIEKTARAISDWHSEADWPLHVDQAKRVAEAIAELLHREGLKDASHYIRSHIFTEPNPRRKQERV